MNKIFTTSIIVSFIVIISTTVIFAQSLTMPTSTVSSISNSSTQIVRYENVYINSGDCLSTIAEEYNTSSMSTKEFTKYIKEFNNLKTDTIYYGNNILVPIYK